MDKNKNWWDQANSYLTQGAKYIDNYNRSQGKTIYYNLRDYWKAKQSYTNATRLADFANSPVATNMVNSVSNAVNSGSNVSAAIINAQLTNTAATSNIANSAVNAMSSGTEVSSSIASASIGTDIGSVASTGTASAVGGTSAAMSAIPVVGAAVSTAEFGASSYKIANKSVVTNADKGANALSGAGAGAAIGTLIAPGIGTVVGAGIGALVGYGIGEASSKDNRVVDLGRISATRTFASGGTVRQPVPINVEGGEIMHVPNSGFVDVNGKRHERGGVKTIAPEGTEIFSNRITMSGKYKYNASDTIANIIRSSINSIKRLQTQAVKDSYKMTNSHIQNTFMRKVMAHEQKMNAAIQFQRDVDAIKNISSLLRKAKKMKKFADGGNVNSNTQPMMFDVNGLTRWDKVGIYGLAMSQGLYDFKTILNRLGDAPYENYYSGITNEAQKNISTLIGHNPYSYYLSALSRGENKAYKLASSNARSINTLRALQDVSSSRFASQLNQLASSDASYTAQLTGMLNSYITQGNQLSAQGRMQAKVYNEQQRDNFYTNLFKGLDERVQYASRIGNQGLNNALTMALLGAGGYFGFDPKTGKIVFKGMPKNEAGKLINKTNTQNTSEQGSASNIGATNKQTQNAYQPNIGFINNFLYNIANGSYLSLLTMASSI